MPRFPLGAFLLAILACSGVLRETAAWAQEPAARPQTPCSSPEASQFDFWIGTWDLTWGEDGKGTNVITKELDGCVVEENFVGVMGEGNTLRGHSVSLYSANRGRWLQTWVDNEGSYLDFEGGWEGDRMVLSRSVQRQDDILLLRMVFRDISENSLEWDWERSTDGGATWTTTWNIHYSRRR